MTRANDIKKSSFVAQGSFLPGDYLDFVRNGQNFRISYTNFIASLGVSGNIAAVGDVAAIPVFYLDAGINKIRGIIGGSGVVASLSVGDAVKLDHNFTVDKTGAPILGNETAVSPVMRSIIGGTGITVAASGNNIIVSESGSPGTTKTVFVYQESDLPTPSGGVITLADDTEYRFLNDVTTTNRFIVGAGTLVSAPNERLITLEYTGALTMFTSTDHTIMFSGIGLKCSSGTFVNFTCSAGTHDFILTNCLVTCDTFGSIDGPFLTYIHTSNITCTTDGLVFTGSCTTFYYSISTFVISSIGAKAIDLNSATFDAIAINNVIFNLADATSYCISGLASGGNINAGGFGAVYSTTQFGNGTFLENITPYDDEWEFSLNLNAENSVNLALATNGGADTVIAVVNTPVLLAGTWTAQQSHRFTITAAGRFTYTGRGSHVTITMTLSGQRAAVGTANYSFYLYKNGGQIAASRVSRLFSNDDGNISLVWADQAATNDYYEVWVENNTGTTDFTTNRAIMRISS